jgi:3-mercaptopyruvate sulfurtransferase SseA
MASGLRTGPEAEKPFTLKDHAEVAAILGRAGIAAGDHVVAYDQNGMMATALLAVLEWAGATHVSYLDGGIEGWHAAGFHLETHAVTRPAVAFTGRPHPSFVVGGATLQGMLGKPGVVVLDARAIHRILGETRHEKAARAGAIPGGDEPAARGAPHGQRGPQVARGAPLDAPHLRHHARQDDCHHL